jgi:hypothetical protein
MKLFLMLLLLAFPAVSFAQQDGAEPYSFNNPTTDIFVQRAETCGSTIANCGTLAGTPANVINAPNFVKGLVSFRVPTNQTYSVFFLATDIEGSLNPATQIVQQGPLTLAAGDSVAVAGQFSALGSGVYKFITIIIGADGRAAISDPYRFRYCNAACITGP